MFSCGYDPKTLQKWSQHRGNIDPDNNERSTAFLCIPQLKHKKFVTILMLEGRKLFNTKYF